MSEPVNAPVVSARENLSSKNPEAVQWIGLGEGLLAVFFFALTLPMSRFAVRELNPMIVGIVRSVIAGVLSVFALGLTGQRWPTKREWLGIAAISPGVIYIFPVLVAWAMKYVPSGHGAIVIGLLPLSTAVFAAVLGFERPPKLFWFAAMFGSGVVIIYSLWHSGGHIDKADLALVAAVIASGLAYATGGRLAKTLGGWQVISWVSAVNLPITLILLYGLWQRFAPTSPLSTSTIAVVIFMGVFNQYVAFFSWYKAMANVGLNRVSQLQLLQPFMTVGISLIFPGEAVTGAALLALVLVMSSIVIARRAAHINDSLPE